ncbi:hypothetical protein Sgly_0313 [Syntrophobotulus glycolicus DSM 8271]|uniref:Uncharacterized protein n=1 Tax=Syntrophobotulus glycolicus (strain DSM 8271 / FlGlyR) TaxID=645991 RepID=F0SXD4_SYNGF|nr:hypothetical protein [Syntrophobotulus glycolicus]ADY54680.1 hypothetical protein Sgly_0313 [Syntrophobotulus glycolicus DSM 8271]
MQNLSPASNHSVGSILDNMIAAHAMFLELKEKGLLSCGTGNFIQVTEDLFTLIPGETVKTPLPSADFPYQYTKNYKGVEFIYVGR